MPFAEKPEVQAARTGRGIQKWVNDKTPGADAVVLTDATLYFNIPVGMAVYITAMHFDVLSVEDDCHFLLVYTPTVAGVGTPVEISGHTHVYTGAAKDTGIGAKERPFNPPIRVEYAAAAAVCVTMKVDANDAAAVISCGWTGWYEPIH